jgi:cytoskeletal protein RodZ
MAVEAGGIGARLRAGREKLGLTVLQVAERMHTDPKIVEAIESESYEALGAPVYARGHIRHYAELVGESAHELIQIYSDLSRVAQPDLTRIVKAPAGPDSSKLVAPALVVIVVFAVAGAIWWVSALSKKKPQMSETHVVTDEAPAASTETPGAAPSSEPSVAPEGASMANAPGATAPGGPSTSGVQGGASRGGESANSATAPPRAGVGGSAAAPGGTTRPASAAATHTAPSAAASSSTAHTVPSTAASSSTAHTAPSTAAASTTARAAAQTAATHAAPSTAAPSPTGRTSSSAAAPTPATRSASSNAAPAPTARATPSAATPTPPPAPTRTASAAPVAAPSAAETAAAPRPRNQSQVTLRYSADSWTEVYDSTGARLFYDVGTANSVKTVVGTPPLRVVLGNASGVAVEYNGHSKPIAKLSRPDGSVQFSITRSGEVVRAKPVADGG